MARNIVLLVSTVAILGLLFIGYWLLVDDSGAPQRESSPGGGLPVGAAPPPDTRVRIAGAVDVPPGEGIEFTLYDKQTGRRTQHFRCEEWTPVRESNNEIRVTRPELTLLLPSGLTAVISAAEGQITVARLEKAAGQPKRGWLRGDVRIALRRLPPAEADQPDSPVEELATVTLEHLQFDLELGALETDGSVRVAGADFALSGTGLDLVWNQAANVVESLVLQRGEEMVLYGGAGLFRAAATDTKPAPARPAAGADAEKKSPASRRKGPAARSGAYACVLTGGVVAEQYAAADRVAELTADEVRLLFDVGAAAERLAQPAPASAPASRPSPERRERLVVRWQGPLRLEPAPTPAAEAPRRRFEAVGERVTLTHADATVRCGRLEVYDETQQIWLHPPPDDRVEFTLGDNLSATASSVYIDQAQRLVKLVGDVTVLSRRGSAVGRPGQTLRCTLWAQLHLSPATQDTEERRAKPRDELLRYGQIQSATFVGDARVDLGDQVLTAQRIDATFKPTPDAGPSSAVLDTATAAGSVRLARGSEALTCEQLHLAFATTGEGAVYPRQMEALGSVMIQRERSKEMIFRERSWARGDRVHAELDPAPPAAGQGDEFVLRTLDILGDAELLDPRHQVAARGQEISAVFAGRSRLSQATVRGSPARHGLVHKWPYTVGGERIDLDWQAQTVHVDGPARLSFKAQRGLEGQRRRQPTPIAVTCDRTLHIDGVRNTVHFAGQVVVASGQEQLRADTLTLLLEDVEKPPATQPGAMGLFDVLRQAGQHWAARRDAGPADDAFDVQVEQLGRTRKEPLRLTASNAVIQSETYEPDDPQPAVHFSVAAPALEVDLVERILSTQGRTTLLLTSRRLDAGAAPEPETFGVPSALITRGPSQTAMQCEKSLRYALGQDGPARRDSAVFEGDVVFVHRAGREMVNLEQMLPQVQTNPELVSNLKSRNTTMQCDHLECDFAVGAAASDRDAGPVVGRSAMRLTWLLASGRADLRDVQNTIIRTMHAHQLDFDRTAGLVRVLGTPQTMARIYEEDPERADSRVLVGTEFLLDLRAGTVRAGATRGEVREK